MLISNVIKQIISYYYKKKRIRFDIQKDVFHTRLNCLKKRLPDKSLDLPDNFKNINKKICK